MAERASEWNDEGAARRSFLSQLGQTALVGGLAAGFDPAHAAAASPPPLGRVRQRILGKTGLKVSEIGFGGHSWTRIAFVLENRQVDCCICGVHTEEHVREHFSASWTGLTREARQRLARVVASGTAGSYGWLEPARVSGQYCGRDRSARGGTRP